MQPARPRHGVMLQRHLDFHIKNGYISPCILSLMPAPPPPMRCLIPAKALHAAEAKVGAKARSGRQGPQVACSAEGRDTARVTRNDSETAGRLDSGGRKASHSECFQLSGQTPPAL